MATISVVTRCLLRKEVKIMKKEDEGMVWVITRTGVDYVKKSHLPRLIREGYVIALLKGTITLCEAAELQQKGIAVTYDGDKKRVIVSPE